MPLEQARRIKKLYRWGSGEVYTKCYEYANKMVEIRMLEDMRNADMNELSEIHSAPPLENYLKTKADNKL
ncbi:MAG: hypothetical protein DRN91_02060 [Candidatus Alkanophagales archaeon]|nr:MAG: hypothetical protein DRN91_02060 [Candidatus Alkanophagales archaeon]